MWGPKISDGEARLFYACLLIGVGVLAIGAASLIGGAVYLLYRGICAVLGV